MIDLSVIVVSYNSGELLERCLQSIRGASSDLSYECIVSDNASIDGSLDSAKKRFHEVTFIQNDSNLGFAGANNRAIQRSRGRYVMLLNPDTEVLGGALAHMMRFLEDHPDVGAVGPKLLNTDGTLQHSIRRFPTLRGQLAEALMLHRVLSGIGVHVGEVDYVDKTYSHARDVEWLSGAAIMVARQTIEDVGLLDDGFFLYSEEKDWCKRIHDAGWRIVFTPGAVVVHMGAEGQASPRLYAELVLSKTRYFRKHNGAVRSFAYRVLLAAQYAGRALAWILVGLPGSDRRRMSIARARAYAAGAVTAVSTPGQQRTRALPDGAR